jgi:hypothetical protein
MKKYLLGIVMMLITAIAFALPSPRDVENSMAQGNFSEAQSMTAEVLREHPESARAHLLNAYLLIHVNHDKTAANAELNTASGLDRKGDVKNSSLFGRTVAEIDLQKATAPPPRAQQQLATVQPYGPITYQQPKESGGHGFLIFLLLVGAVGTVIVIIFIRGANNKAQRIDHSDIPRGYTPIMTESNSRIESYRSQTSPLYPAIPPYPQQPVIIQQQPVAQGSQGLGFGGQMAATAGGVIAGEAIFNAFRPKHSSAGDYDDTEERRRRRDRDSTPAYTPDPYVAPDRDPSPVSSSNERASYSSGSDNSWSSGSSSSSDYSSSSSDSSSSWSSDSSSSSGGDSW